MAAEQARMRRMPGKADTALDADELVRALYEKVERFLPHEYRPLVRSFIGMTMGSSWPDAVDFIACIVKEYGRSEDGRGYKQTFSVVDELLAKVGEYGTVQRQPVQEA